MNVIELLPVFNILLSRFNVFGKDDAWNQTITHDFKYIMDITSVLINILSLIRNPHKNGHTFIIKEIEKFLLLCYASMPNHFQLFPRHIR